ncbi:HAMP domain-containing sensor histidine kinase [Paenibacillus sp. J22TS3]|uniref:sensor histidine kinase n=1 Tax=Paenibacillus sp. J22TS3 TaxID=2807192 RepID=UPI001B1DFA85|nr:HAMP domain-containing sensor histidine kinase [Paenibacillus sp. J22TS3]GIP22024.1 two-component sensor histidine kinase [Paenibacillus sp. J22TS3]
MKFWQKAFVGILLVFIISLDISLYLTSRYSFDLNLKRDTDRALGEYHFIINGLNDSINSIHYRWEGQPSQAYYESLMQSYADYYGRQRVFLGLRGTDKMIFSNIPADVGLSKEQPEQEAYTMRVKNSSGIHYLIISGKIGGQLEGNDLVYVRDLTELYQANVQLTWYLVIVSIAVEITLSLVLFLFLRKLTHPIRILQSATRTLSDGIYNSRIQVPGKDEFHDLAENFNQMAESIQDKMDELDRNARDKQRLIDNLAHELRTPLTAIRGYAEYLQGANTHERNRIKAADHMIREIDRIKNLAFKLLDLSLAKNHCLELQEIGVLEIFSQVKLMAGLVLKERKLRLTLHADSELAKLTCDVVLLQSLLLNLVENAAKASTDGSVIEMYTYGNPVSVLEIRDYGMGMQEEQLQYVFEPFYRVDSARSRNSGGVGLGLTLCREIARLHEAELQLISQPGEGTTARLSFTTSLQPAEYSQMSAEI